jgi:type I restriction enzyme M protein
MEIQIENNKIFAPLINQWVQLSAEEKVRQSYICRLVNSYGFSLKQIAQDYLISGLSSSYVHFSLVVWRNAEAKKNKKNPIIFIQCKADSIVIRQEDYFKGIEAAKKIGAAFFVATNSKQTKIFSKAYSTNSIAIDEILDIPNFVEAQSDDKINNLLAKTNDFAREDFTRTLYKCHNIIRNNDKLSPEAAFDEISKVLFIKTLYERSNKDGNIFSSDIYEKEKKQYVNSFLEKSDLFYQELFKKVKNDLKDDDLFDLNEIIRIRENSFEAIIKELEIYNLSTTSDDVKGIAFEQFLGRTFRGELGQFFTPRTVVDFMVDILDPQEGEVICDPCCGSGGFLIKTFEYVRGKIENDIQKIKEKIQDEYINESNYIHLSDSKKSKVDHLVDELFTKLNAELDVTNRKGRLHKLSYESIFGTDANPRMSRTAKMNMIMHGDGHGGVHHNDGLLNVNGIFEDRFDIILTNPPFGSRVEKSLKISEEDKYTDSSRIKKYREIYGEAYDQALRQVNDNIGRSILSLYKTGSMSTLTEVLFLERCLNLLKPGGRMGIVLPEGVLNNTNLQKIRDFIESKAKIVLITSIPQDVFIASGATVKPSLLFFKKFTIEETEQYTKISKKAATNIRKKYEQELNSIKEKLALKGKDSLSIEEKKEIKLKNKNILDKIEVEVKVEIKKYFNYQIPIAEVEKAGISTVGTKIDNELLPLAQEFKEYRNTNELWKSSRKVYNYNIIDEEIYRTVSSENNSSQSKPETFYN